MEFVSRDYRVRRSCSGPRFREETVRPFVRRSAGRDRTVIMARSNYVNCTTRTGLESGGGGGEEDPKRVTCVMSAYIHGILRLADANEGR